MSRSFISSPSHCAENKTQSEAKETQTSQGALQAGSRKNGESQSITQRRTNEERQRNSKAQSTT